MMVRMSVTAALLVGTMTGQATAATTVGFLNLPRSVASHPLHSVLAQYDSEIAALRSTQNVEGLHSAQATAQQAAAALQTEAAAAADRAEQIGTRNAASYRAVERAGIAQIARARHAAMSGVSIYTTELISETNANLRAYGGALTQRSERAYAAREQQLREKELTLAFDLEKRDAGKRLMLQVRLNDLRLTPSRRANLQTELAELNANELRGVEAMRRADAEELAAYRTELQQDANAAAGEMDRQLRSKAGANYAILQRVFNEAGNGLGELPSSSQLAAFADGYAAPESAQGIANGMRTAAGDVSGRFRQIGASDALSRNDAGAALRTLVADRDALYRAIVAQVKSEAMRLARERGLARVEFSSATSTGGVDLTPAVAARLARDWN
jgi:Skp family chaperone for outer membrane proteins